MGNKLGDGFENNVNHATIRTSGSSLQRCTDRRVDIDGDGVKEQVTVTGGTAATTTANGSLIITPPTVSSEANSLLGGDNTGVKHSVLERTMETDRGVDLTNEDNTVGA